MKSRVTAAASSGSLHVLAFVGVDLDALDLVLGAEALVGLGAGLDVLHLHLHEGAAAAADVHVVGLEHAPDALVPLEEVTDTDLDCFNFGHEDETGCEKGANFTRFIMT